jgi:PAS domain-containing protein
MSASSLADLSSSFDHAPRAVIASSGEAHIVRYANPAFCRLIDKAQDEVIGRPFDGLAPQTDEWLARLDRVYRTGAAATYTAEEQAAPRWDDRHNTVPFVCRLIRKPSAGR